MIYVLKKSVLWLLIACLIIGLLGFSSCSKNTDNPVEPFTETDYSKQLKLDFTSNTLKQEVTVKNFVDGDTTHFYPVKDSDVTGYYDFADQGGYVKARYLAVNTPESTGKIEEWGKAAAHYTRERLENASSIVIESDNDCWNLDSTGSRLLLWIWYIPEGESEYRNLNLELLQNGYAIASSTANNRYGTTAMAALNQAKTLQLRVWSKEPDPDFYYGDAIPLTLKELRCNIADYNGMKVSFEGVVTGEYSQTAYLEDYDEETGLYFGMTVYYGFGAGSDILNALTVGNRARVVGTVQYYEAGGTYQVSGLTYKFLDPNDPTNTIKLGEGYEPGFAKTDAATFVGGNVEISIETEDGSTKKVTLPYHEAVMSSTISVDNLKVKSVYTTSSGGSSDGAMTLTCEAPDGTEVTVRTAVLYENGNLITGDAYLGKTVNVKGIVAIFDGCCQIYCYRPIHITVLG